MGFQTDHSINVFLHSGDGVFKRTSSNNSIEEKRYRTSGKNTSALRFAKRPTHGTKGMVKKISGVAPVLSSIYMTSKVLNTANRMAGIVTNNRYSVQRTGDALQQVFNPIGFYKRALKFGITNHFEIMRQNKRVDYDLKLSGNMLPYRRKDGGATI